MAVERVFQASFRSLHKFCCHNPVVFVVNPVSTRTKLLSKQFLPFSDTKHFSNDSSDSDECKESHENSGKLIELVVTSLRVDRVAASGLGLARRY